MVPDVQHVQGLSTTGGTAELWLWEFVTQSAGEGTTSIIQLLQGQCTNIILLIESGEKWKYQSAANS